MDPTEQSKVSSFISPAIPTQSSNHSSVTQSRTISSHVATSKVSESSTLLRDSIQSSVYSTTQLPVRGSKSSVQRPSFTPSMRLIASIQSSLESPFYSSAEATQSSVRSIQKAFHSSVRQTDSTDQSFTDSRRSFVQKPSMTPRLISSSPVLISAAQSTTSMTSVVSSSLVISSTRSVLSNLSKMRDWRETTETLHTHSWVSSLSTSTTNYADRWSKFTSASTPLVSSQNTAFSTQVLNSPTAQLVNASQSFVIRTEPVVGMTSSNAWSADGMHLTSSTVSSRPMTSIPASATPSRPDEVGEGIVIELKSKDGGDLV